MTLSKAIGYCEKMNSKTNQTARQRSSFHYLYAQDRETDKQHDHTVRLTATEAKPSDTPTDYDMTTPTGTL